MKALTDARRLYVELRDAGILGLHSHEIRHRGYSGNPSQRMKDIVSYGVAISTRREPRGKRPGSRYWLAEHAPPDAIPVRANNDLGGSPAAAREGETDAPARPVRRVHPPETGAGAGYSRTEAESAGGESTLDPVDGARLRLVRDYTDPAGEWEVEAA